MTVRDFSARGLALHQADCKKKIHAQFGIGLDVPGSPALILNFSL